MRYHREPSPKKKKSFFDENKEKTFFSKPAAAPGFSLSKAPESFISKKAGLSRQQQRDEDVVRKQVPKAVALLGKAKAFMAAGAQESLLNEMLNVFNSISPEQVGTLGADKELLKQGQPLKLFYSFKNEEGLKPFEYRIRLFVSHETEGPAGGYFHNTGNYGGNIVINIAKAKSVSADGIAGLLVHEAIHMFSHLQRSVSDRIGSREATAIPGKQAARILDVSSFTAQKKAFATHFGAVQRFLNSQPHRKNSFNQLTQDTIDDWVRKVVEETIAYVYQTRTSMAMANAKVAGARGAKVAVAMGFVPMQFLKDYVTRHWLTDKDDQKAMATKEGQALLQAMSTDLQSLHQAVEAQVGPEGQAP